MSTRNLPIRTVKRLVLAIHNQSIIPSGVGKIPWLNAVILGEALASEDNNLIFPSEDFSKQALVPSPIKYLEMYQRSEFLKDKGKNICTNPDLCSHGGCRRREKLDAKSEEKRRKKKPSQGQARR